MMSSGSSDPSPSNSEELFLQPETQELYPESEELAGDGLSSIAEGEQLEKRGHRLKEFLGCGDPFKAIELWLGRPLSRSKDNKEEISRKLNRDVAVIDEQLNKQLNAVIHHPRFQKLEASWRGLQLLHGVLNKESHEHDPLSPRVKLKILDVSWKELETDFAGYVEESAIFDKVYEQEFGTYGGEPFGLLIGDYEINNVDSSGNVDDLFVLDNMSAVAASAFSPFLTNASPKMLDLDDFSQLDEISDLKLHDDIKNVKWNRLINKEDARFLGLCLPRILMRCPYGERPEFGLAAQYDRNFREASRLNEFCFREDTKGNDSSKHLWGGAAFAYAAVVMRAFCRTGWLNDIRGVDQGHDGGGLITELPVEYYAADRDRVIPKPSTDGMVTDALEKELSDLGFIPLCSIYGSPNVAFYSGVSIQKPKKYDSEIANVNAKMSSMIHNMLCVSRFAHYLKKIGRETIGRYNDPAEIENELLTWIGGYVTSDVSANAKAKAKYPLFNADVQVRSLPHKAGVYEALFDLQPHYEIEGLNAGIRLKTEL